MVVAPRFGGTAPSETPASGAVALGIEPASIVDRNGTVGVLSPSNGASRLTRGNMIDVNINGRRVVYVYLAKERDIPRTTGIQPPAPRRRR